MPTSSMQKMKLIYLMETLLERSDEEHPLSIQELIKALAEYDISAERKSIYSDLEYLRLYGLDIVKVQSKSHGYYVASRDFELPELKLLVDAVHSSHFITKKKSDELIKKLSALTSTHQAKQLRRQVYLADRPKALNESVYYNIDSIHNAINEGKKISFKYFDYDIGKSRVYRRDGNLYTLTPMALCWNSDKYYLICFNAKYENFTHFRVDRLSQVTVCKEKADQIDTKKFNVNQHIKQSFGMYGGQVVQAKLLFHKELINTVLDRFGTNISLREQGNDIIIHVEVAESLVFLSWMVQFGDKAEILSPDSLRTSMCELVKGLSGKYLKA